MQFSLLVLVGTLTACVLEPSAAACDYSRYAQMKGTRQSTTLGVTSVGSCESKCQGNVKCVGFNYNDGQCTQFSSISGWEKSAPLGSYACRIRT